jgi:hypothetical protein
VLECSMTAKRRFQLVLIKPSHYDDDGYVIRWWRAMIPSNSLAAVYGIAADCAERQVLGPDVAIDIEVIDETNTRIDVPTLLARFRSHSNFGLVALTGVQSNQYPRALDIARPFRDAGIQVAMGGFHVSGCLSMLDGRAVDLDTCRDMGIAMFAGEAENRLDTVLRDAADGRLAPLYDFMKDLPGIEDTPVPFLPKRYVARTLGLGASFDAGRGCPYQCSFCTIINVQGRKSRYRSADDVEHLVRLNWGQGIHKFFITDDNFARNKEWEDLWKNGVLMEPDLNAYDVEHVCTAHAKMSKAEWEAIYCEAWSLYYTPAHMKTLLRRAAATGVPMGSLLKLLVSFATMVRLENVHPLQSGLLRLKHPSERRPGLPRERVWVFWPRFVWETLSKHVILAGVIAGLFVSKIAIACDPHAPDYMDPALTPVDDDNDATLDLLTKTAGASAAIAHIRKVAELTGASRLN